MLTASLDEYDAIADEIRNSLILRELTEEDREYIDLIPNTATVCPLDGAAGSLYLVALNMGELYDLADIQNPLQAGYDEISKNRVILRHRPDGGKTVLLHREDGSLSIQRMKRIFCEACIWDMAAVLEQQSVSEFLLFDASEHQVHPISENSQFEIGTLSFSVQRGTQYHPNDYRLEFD